MQSMTSQSTNTTDTDLNIAAAGNGTGAGGAAIGNGGGNVVSAQPSSQLRPLRDSPQKRSLKRGSL